MPCIVKRLTAQGLQSVEYAANSLADAARHEPHDGVYTVTNTFETTKVLKLDAHLDRLEDSARRANISLVLDRSRLRAALREMISGAGYGDVRFRVTVPADTPDAFILSIEPFTPISAQIIESGVRVTTVHAERHDPAAKTTGWMHDRTAIEANLPTGIYTALIVDEHGAILEGLSSNFYAILEGELRSAGGGVLPGIAQQIVYEVAPAILPVRKEAVTVSDIPRLSEAFITSASRGVVPVVEIDGVALGDGSPGTKTKAIRAAYQGWLEGHLEEL